MSQVGWVILCKTATICLLWTAYQCAQTLCKCQRWMWEAIWGAVSLNHDLMTSVWLHKWPKTQKSEPITVDNCVKLPCQSTACHCAQTHYICLMWMREAVWGSRQPQSWCTDSYNRMPGQHINVLKYFVCLIWMQKAVWGGCQPQPWCNDSIPTPPVWISLCKASTVCWWEAYQCAQTWM